MDDYVTKEFFSISLTDRAKMVYRSTKGRGIVMSDEDFMKIVREYINRVAETEVDKLIERILSRERKSKEELLELEKDVRDFFRSDASDEDKRKLSGYTEGLSMICCAIREGRL